MFSSGAENKPFWTFHQPRIAFLCWSAASHLLPFYWLILLLEPVLWSIPGAAGQALPASKRAGKQTRHLMERWGESCRHTHPGVPNLHWYSRNKKSIPFQDVVFFPPKWHTFRGARDCARSCYWCEIFSQSYPDLNFLFALKEKLCDSGTIYTVRKPIMTFQMRLLEQSSLQQIRI